MTSEFDDVFSRFRTLANDYNLAQLAEEVANELLSEYLVATLSQPEVRKVFSVLNVDKDVGEIEYTMRNKWDDEADKDFVEHMLSLGMLCQWMSPKYFSVLNTSQFYGNSEQRFYSQKNQMDGIQDMYEKAIVDFHRFIRDRSYGLALYKGE